MQHKLVDLITAISAVHLWIRYIFFERVIKSGQQVPKLLYNNNNNDNNNNNNKYDMLSSMQMRPYAKLERQSWRCVHVMLIS